MSHSPSEAASFHDFERAGWRSAVPVYARTFTELTRQAAPHLLDAARVAKDTRLLDLASGPGDLSGLAAQRGARVLGLDFAPEMVAAARARYPGVEFREGDAQALPFEGPRFDAVTMSFLLGHLTSPERAVAEAFRVLESGGRVAISWWATMDRTVVFGIIRGAVEAHGRTDVGLPEGPPFDRYSDPEAMREALLDAGFQEPSATLADMTWRVASAEQLIPLFMEGTVRTAGLLRAQSPGDLEKIRAAVTEASRPYAREGGIEFPMPAWIYSARRP